MGKSKILLALSLTALLGQMPEIPPLPQRPAVAIRPKRRTKKRRKFWANIAAGVMTYKFIQMPEAPEWAWWAYGAMVGGYALIKRGIAAVPQLAEINQSKEQDDVGGAD